MEKNKKPHLIAGILMLIYVVAFLVIAGRFIFIEATGEVDGIDLKKWAKDKRTSSYVISAERGKIFDNTGMTLAYDRPVYRMYAVLDPNYSKNQTTKKHVDDIDKTAEKLSGFINLDKAEIKERLTKGKDKKSFQVEFGVNGKNIPQQLKEKIEKAKIPGINFIEEANRYYPNGVFASHIIGFSRKNEGSQIHGVTGMEKEMDKLLSGKNGHISYERDKFNKKLLDPKEVVKQAEDGKDIYLTIDQKIQILLEDTLTSVQKEYEPERMTAIVMNPKTGEILAMSNRPSYNPNNPNDVVNWYNDAISTPFEPGSTMKMFTWAAAIDAGVYDGNELYQSGKYKINDKIRAIADHNHGDGWGKISYDEGFQRSSNVAASKLVWEKLGTEDYLKYLEAFKLDEKTGIDLPGEVPGHILYNWPAEKLTTSFGQGSTVTPIQQMMAATAIVNDGKMLQPQVIKKIVDPTTNKVVQKKKPKVIGKPISKDTSKQVMDLLEAVVQGENGTGKSFGLEDYSVAGKTGTAQIPNPDGPGYMIGKDNYIFSFLGMAPKDNPQLMMYVSVKQPKLKPTELGSEPVSFIFNNVMENGLHYLNINPDKEDQPEIKEVEIPEIVGESTKEIEDKLKKSGVQVIKIGNGQTVKATNAIVGEKRLPTDEVMLITDQPVMPDITGWSLRKINKMADLLDLHLETIGQGYVIKQSIKKDQPLKKGDYLGVELLLPNEKKKEPEKKPPKNQ